MRMRHILRCQDGRGALRLILIYKLDRSLWNEFWVGVGVRLVGFLGCIAGAAVCFAVAFFTLPLLALRPAKFALAFRYETRSVHIYLVDRQGERILQLGKSTGHVRVCSHALFISTRCLFYPSLGAVGSPY